MEAIRGRGVALLAGASMGRRRGAEQAQAEMNRQQLEAMQQAQQAPAPQAAPGGQDITAELQKLAQLHSSGALTDEEFASAKQRLLSK